MLTAEAVLGNLHPDWLPNGALGVVSFIVAVLCVTGYRHRLVATAG